MLAEALFAGVHQLGDLLGVGAPFGIGDVGELRRPRRRLDGDDSAGAPADAGVDDGVDVADAGQVPLPDRVGQDLAGVQAGQFGGP